MTALAQKIYDEVLDLPTVSGEDFLTRRREAAKLRNGTGNIL